MRRGLTRGKEALLSLTIEVLEMDRTQVRLLDMDPRSDQDREAAV